MYIYITLSIICIALLFNVLFVYCSCFRPTKVSLKKLLESLSFFDNNMVSTEGFVMLVATETIIKPFWAIFIENISLALCEDVTNSLHIAGMGNTTYHQAVQTQYNLYTYNLYCSQGHIKVESLKKFDNCDSVTIKGRLLKEGEKYYIDAT